MVGFTTSELAVRDVMAANFQDLVPDECCVAGNLDSLLDAMFSRAAPFGIYLDYGGGRPKNAKVFGKNSWTWNVTGFVIMHYSDEVDGLLRQVIDRLHQLFITNPTLDKKVSFAEILEIAAPEMSQINDTPFYWLPFTVSVTDL
jgi:hypothetical protein